ncbi:MAG TPA: hypothetical protein VM285_10325 [Polyangia bacterium]|nr:hypothetical protein [Polyangia bacterium]
MVVSRNWMLVPAMAASLFLLACEQLEPSDQEKVSAALSAADGTDADATACPCGKDCKCGGAEGCKCGGAEGCKCGGAEGCKCGGAEGCAKAAGDGCPHAKTAGCPFATGGEGKPACGRHRQADSEADHLLQPSN